MGEKVDCSCGGSNENCVLCGGLGEYTIRFGRLLGAPKLKKLKRNVRPDLLPLIDKFGDFREKADARIKLAVRVDGQEAKCPHRLCDFRGSRDEVYRHMQWSHPNAERSNESVLRDRMECPLCDAKLNRADFTMHLRGKHRTTWEAVEQLAQSTTAWDLSIVQSSRKMECALCSMGVPMKDIEMHYESRHSTNIDHLRALVPSKESKAGNPSPEKSPKSDGVVERTQEDTLEAHRYMGYVVREHGRYGSHPLHDKHDDESMP
jgi:hypothetical protein